MQAKINISLIISLVRRRIVMIRNN